MRRNIVVALLSLLFAGFFMQGCDCASDPRYSRRHHHRKIKVTFFADGARCYRGDDNFWYVYSSNTSGSTWVKQTSSPMVGRTIIAEKEEPEDQLENETAEITEEPDSADVSDDGAADSSGDSSGDSGGGDGGSSD